MSGDATRKVFRLQDYERGGLNLTGGAGDGERLVGGGFAERVKVKSHVCEPGLTDEVLAVLAGACYREAVIEDDEGHVEVADALVTIAEAIEAITTTDVRTRARSAKAAMDGRYE